MTTPMAALILRVGHKGPSRAPEVLASLCPVVVEERRSDWSSLEGSTSHSVAPGKSVRGAQPLASNGLMRSVLPESVFWSVDVSLDVLAALSLPE